MPVSKAPAIATRQFWKTQPVQAVRADLGFAQTYDHDDWVRIKRGLIPIAMEGKWFIFFEAPWLYVHRSWTGRCVYGVRFRLAELGFGVAESWVTREGYNCVVASDRAILGFLIEHELLGRSAFFSVCNHPFGWGYGPSMAVAAPPKRSPTWALALHQPEQRP
jgi:hypothetical protein